MADTLYNNNNNYCACSFNQHNLNLSFSLYATGYIEQQFKSEVMVVFTGVVQMFLRAENESIMELPSAELLDGVRHQMAAYCVWGRLSSLMQAISPVYTGVRNGH
jgi:hypothetical protein